MRKNVYGRQFKRDFDERKALFKGLVSSLVLEERISTTEEKAKAVKPLAEKLVTKAKMGGLHARSLVQPYLNAPALKKMMSEVGPRFQNRNGGYTRIIRLGRRFNDDASMVRLEWVEIPERIKTPKAEKKAAAETVEAEAPLAKKPVKKATVKAAPKKVAAKVTAQKKTMKQPVKKGGDSK